MSLEKMGLATAVTAVGAALLLAGGAMPPVLDILLVAVLWLAVPGGLMFDVIRGISWMDADDRPPLMPPVLRRLLFWGELAAVLATSAVLFSTDRNFLASIATVHVFCLLFSRLFVLAAWERYETPDESDNGEPEKSRRISALSRDRMGNGLAAFAVAMAAGPLWLVLGGPPAWAQSVIVTLWWAIAPVMLLISMFALYNFAEYPIPNSLFWRLNGLVTKPERPPPASAPVRWVAMLSIMAAPLALAVNGRVFLAGLIVLAMLMFCAGNLRYGITQDPDAGQRHNILSRAIRYPMIHLVLMLFSPIRHFSTLLGVGAARQASELRDAFGRPDGFIYFVYAEPWQKKRYGGNEGLLAPFAEHVVVREWRRDLKLPMKEQGWLDFAKSPDGRIMARYGLHNMRRDLPFLLIVPPEGCPDEFHLNPHGDANISAAEFAVTARAAKAFGPGTG